MGQHVLFFNIQCYLALQLPRKKVKIQTNFKKKMVFNDNHITKTDAPLHASQFIFCFPHTRFRQYEQTLFKFHTILMLTTVS